MYEAFVMAAREDDSPFHEARNQIFLGSDAFVRETLKHISRNDIMGTLPREQKMAGRPTLQELFVSNAGLPKNVRNIMIKAAFEEHQYTLKEIGEYLQLNPNYLSRLLGDMRKK